MPPKNLFHAIVIVGASLTGGCGDADTDDAGAADDAGPTVVDAGPGGADAGGRDAGMLADAGRAMDGGRVDAGSDAAAGPDDAGRRDGMVLIL